MNGVLRFLTARNLRLGLIAVPWLVACVYLLVLAKDRYVSESVVAVRQNAESMAGVDTLTSLFGTNGPTSREDEYMLEAHVLSLDMLVQLDERIDLRTQYSAPWSDPFFRLSGNASQEKFLSYYRDRTEVVVDDNSGLITIRTQAFTPEVAESINREVIAISEQFINESSHRLAREQMAFAEAELEKARKNVHASRDDVLEFQRKHGVVDPVAQITANTGLAVELQAMLARQEAELKALTGYLHDDAPQVRAVRAQIAGTRAQLEEERSRSIASIDGVSLNVLAGHYQELLAELQFAQDSYALALTGVETARVESTRKLKSLVLVESPRRPQAAEYPKRLYSLFALLIGQTLLYGIARLVVATIEDHQQ